MKYLSIFTPTHFVAYVLNVRTAQQEDINHAYALAERMGCTAVLSNYRNVLKAHFKRREDTGEIYLSDLPRRFDNDSLLAFLDELSEKLHKKSLRRKQHPNSLANLERSCRFTSDNRPNKPRKVHQADIERARELRRQGCSWRVIGDRLGLNSSSVRSALRADDEKSAKNKAKTELLGG